MRGNARNITIPQLQKGDPKRIVVEACPGVLARTVIGRRSYKYDTKKKQTPEKDKARRKLLKKILNGALKKYGLRVTAPMALAEDHCGDHIDALLCAIQAAWGWRNRENDFSAPRSVDPLEGRIADPQVLRHVNGQ